jgi:hypothetical protein
MPESHSDAINLRSEWWRKLAYFVRKSYFDRFFTREVKIVVVKIIPTPAWEINTGVVAILGFLPR